MAQAENVDGDFAVQDAETLLTKQSELESKRLEIERLKAALSIAEAQKELLENDINMPLKNMQSRSDEDEISEEETDDIFFKNVEEFTAATHSESQSAERIEKAFENGKAENESSAKRTCDKDYGFGNTDVVLIEAIQGTKAKFGSGILLQNPKTWGEVDEEPRQFILTDAHCVCKYDGKIEMCSEIRIRVPKLPWVDFPNSKKYPLTNMKAMGKFFSTITVDPISDVSIHRGYKGGWWNGSDVALIKVPEITPTHAEKYFKVWEPSEQPTSCAIIGFPFIPGKNGKTYSHQPLVSLTKGDNICQIRNEGKSIRYFGWTKAGMSGGAVQLDDTIVGLHSAGDSGGYAYGTLLTHDLKAWIVREIASFARATLRKQQNKRNGKKTFKATFAHDMTATLFEDGTVESSSAGEKQELLVDVEGIAVTDYGAFAAWKRDGTVVVWGNKNAGGDPGRKQSELTDVEFIVGNPYAFAAKKRDGTVVVWGKKKWGGEAYWKQKLLTGIESIAAGLQAFAAKKFDGTVIAWGDREAGGEVGEKEQDLVDVEFIVANPEAFVAKKHDGTCVMWGNPGCGGELVTDTGATCKRVEYRQSDLVDIVAIGRASSTTSGAFAAMKSDGSIICWGRKHLFDLAIQDCKMRHANKQLFTTSFRIPPM